MFRFANRAKKFFTGVVKLATVLAIALPPVSIQARSRKYERKNSLGDRYIISPELGKLKGLTLKHYMIPIGVDQGLVIEKYYRGKILLERITMWADKMIIEIDRNGDGYLDEWDAYSDSGRIRMEKPSFGVFAEMDAEILLKDPSKNRRVKMHFKRESTGRFRLQSRSSSPIDYMWAGGSGSEVVGSAPVDGGSYGMKQSPIDDANAAAKVRENATVNNVVKSIVDEQTCQKDEAKAAKEAAQNVLTGERKSSTNVGGKERSLFLTCLRKNEMDKEADHLQAALLKNEKLPGRKAPFRIKCQKCESQQNSQGKTNQNSSKTGESASSQPDAEKKEKVKFCDGKKTGAYHPTGGAAGDGVPTMTMVQQNQGQNQSQNPPKKSHQQKVAEYSRTIMHEILHHEYIANDNQVVAILDCCAPEDGKEPNCDSKELNALRRKGTVGVEEASRTQINDASPQSGQSEGQSQQSSAGDSGGQRGTGVGKQETTTTTDGQEQKGRATVAKSDAQSPKPVRTQPATPAAATAAATAPVAAAPGAMTKEKDPKKPADDEEGTQDQSAGGAAASPAANTANAAAVASRHARPGTTIEQSGKPTEAPADPDSAKPATIAKVKAEAVLKEHDPLSAPPGDVKDPIGANSAARVQGGSSVPVDSKSTAEPGKVADSRTSGEPGKIAVSRGLDEAGLGANRDGVGLGKKDGGPQVVQSQDPTSKADPRGDPRNGSAVAKTEGRDPTRDGVKDPLGRDPSKDSPRTSSSQDAPSRSGGDSYRREYHHQRSSYQGPTMAKEFEPAVYHQVALGFTQTIATALAANPQNEKTVTVADPTTPVMKKSNVAEAASQTKPVEKLSEPASQARVIGAQPDAQRGPASVAAVAEDGKARDGATAPKNAADTGAGPAQPVQRAAAAKQSSGPAPPKSQALASVAARGVRLKAKKSDPVARNNFIKQMTMLNREEMRLALQDGEVRNSLREYVIGAIDDRGKRRDESVNPRDWLIYNDQKQRMVFRHLGLARK